MKTRLIILLLIVISAMLPDSGVAAVPDGFRIYSSGSVEITGPGIKAIAVQPWDAKIVIGGEFTVTGGDPAVSRQNLARINPDGTLDITFNPPVLNGAVNAIALQPDRGTPANQELGYIIAGGSFTEADGDSQRKGLIRIRNGDGSLDGSFPRVTTTTAPVRVNAIVLQQDGMSILVGGRFDEIAAGVPSPNLARITVAAPDAGAAGWLYSGGINGEVNAVLLQNGRILAAGSFTTPDNRYLAIARFTSDGLRDESFIPVSPGGGIRSMALQEDGKILIGGEFSGGALARNYLARLDGSGSLDALFDAGLEPAGGSRIASILVQPDGNIMVGGAFTIDPASATRYLARLSIGGTFQTTLHPPLDGEVNVIAQQPDGNILAGGTFSDAGGTPRTRLARFYPQGVLDDDMPDPAINGGVTRISLRPEGITTLAGGFTAVRGEVRGRIARLTQEWKLDPDFSAALTLSGTSAVLATFPDDRLLAGGGYWTVNGKSQRLMVRLDPNGVYDATSPFNSNVTPFMDIWGTVESIVLLPSGTLLPNGTPVADDMVYVGGRYWTGDPQYRYLARFQSNGIPDPDFRPPPEVDGDVHAIAIQPHDNKVLIGTKTGKILRLLTDGTLDPDWQISHLNGAVRNMVLLPDKRIVAVGQFKYTKADDPFLFERNILLLNEDGIIDPDFNFELFLDWGGYSTFLFGVTLQADKSLLLYGSFSQVKDLAGNILFRDYVTRLKYDESLTPPGWKLDPSINLGAFVSPIGAPTNMLHTINLQPDGKMLIGGDFIGVDGTGRKKVARFRNGWASQELSVSQDGATHKITWKRGGSSPELWRVSFERFDEEQSKWVHLGHGHRIEGGWELDGQNLAQYGRGVNRLVRARGYTAGDRGNNGSLMESVKLYYLPETVAVTVTAEAKWKEYGDADPQLTYTCTPVLSCPAGFTGSLSRVAGENAGTRGIEQGTLAPLNGNYTVTFVGADLTIRPRVITVTAEAKSKSYGDPDPALTYTFSPALVGTDSFTGVLSRAAGETPGNWAIQQGTLALSGNYTLNYVGRNLTIGKKTVTVTAEAKSKSYGDPDPALTYTFTPALVGTDSFTGALSRAAGETPGNWAIEQGTLALSGNYTLNYVGRNLTIGKKTVTVTAEAKSKSYGDPDPALTYTFTPPLVGTDSFNGVLSRAAGETPGNWAIQQGTLALSSDYILNYVGADLTIAEKIVTVTAEAKSKTYGDPDPELTYTFTPALSGTDSFTGALSRAANENVGSWAIERGTLALSSNYALNYVARNLTIDRKPATVTSLSAGKRYGEADPSSLATELSGFLPGDLGAGKITFSSARAAGENAATYPIAPALNDNGSGLLANYLVTLNPGTFTISKAPMRVTADNKARPWGEPNPVLTATFDPPVTEAQLGGAPSLVTAAVAESPVGDYAIVAGPGSITSTNYEYTFADGILAVGRVAQTINFEPIADRVYGDPDFNPASSTSTLPITYTSSNTAVAIIVNGQIRITGAGNTVITASQEGNATYAPATSVSRPFTVKRAPLRVIADNKARAYQTPNPPLTWNCRGFVNGDNISVVSGSAALSTAAVQQSAVGDYPIEVRVGTLAAQNYSFVPVNATLSILKSCQEIVFPPVSDRTYGDPPFELTAYACSGRDIGISSSNPAVARVAGTTVTITGAGSATFTASQEGSGDLERAPDVSRSLVVHRSGQTLAFDLEARKVLGEPPFTLSATASSGLPVSYLSSEPGVAWISGDVVTIVGVGTTVITALQEGNGDYSAALPASQPLTVTTEETPPSLSISTLSSGAVTACPVLNIMGAARDDSGIARLTVNGSDLTGRASLFSSAVALNPGDNSVSITAKDVAGNVTTQVLNITLDARAPAVNLVEPADNGVTDAASFTVRGAVTPGSAVTLAVNGAPPQSLAVNDAAFTGSGHLVSGVNTIEVSATLSGRSSTIKRSVTSMPGKPFVAITEPGEDIRTERQSVTIRGVAGAVGSSAAVRLDVNGSVFTPLLQEGAFQQQIALDQDGEVAIVATVTDSSGNSSVAQRNIIKVQKVVGDLNGDGSVDIQDALALLRISLELESVTAEALSHGDVAPLVNGVPQPDGVIDVGDVLVLLRKIVGLVQY